MSMWPAIDPTTDGPGIPPLQMISPSPEEKATVLEHAKVSCPVALAHDAYDCWSKNNTKNLVLNRLCRDLATFKSTKELLSVFADAVDAHQQALDKANILHGDVSVGNIFITGEGRGVLLDWDVSKPVSDTEKCAGQAERIGTFQFLSARLVCNTYDFGPHDRLDDIESFFHALQWAVLHFVSHGLCPITPGTTLFITFDSVFWRSDGIVHCHGRLSNVWNSMWTVCEDFTGVLLDLLEDVRKPIHSRYIRPKDMQGPLAAYEEYLNQKKLGILEKWMEFAARPAILYHQLIDPDWFRDRLREAVENPRCPNDDPSTLQSRKDVNCNPCVRQLSLICLA